MNARSLLEDVIVIAEDAGQAILEIYNNQKYKHWHKEDSTPLTTADLASHELIVERLSELTPDFPILSEESLDIDVEQVREWSTYWLVDPLDGTQDFINRTDDFSVVIALMENQIPILGVIVEPVTQNIYSAVKNSGAYFKQGGKESRVLSLNKKTWQDNDAIEVVISSRESKESYLKHLNSKYQYEFSSKGSCSLKCCYVAEGKADCYVRAGPTSIWDTAAAQCIIEEVGGHLLTFSHQKLEYRLEDTWLNPPFYVIGTSDLDWKNIFS